MSQVYFNMRGPGLWGWSRVGRALSPYYFPFDVRLRKWSVYYGAWSSYWATSNLYTLYKAGTTDFSGDEIIASARVNNRSGTIITFPETATYIIEGVTEGNIDGNARLNFSVDEDGDGSNLVLVYDAVDSAHTGKDVYSVGGRLCNDESTGFFSPLHTVHAWTGWDPAWGGLPSGPTAPAWFWLDRENIPSPTGWTYPSAAVPWPRPGTFSDFRLAVDPGGPDGVYTLSLRVDGQSVMSITTAAGSQRVWTPSGATSAFVQTGQPVCFLCEGAGGSVLDGVLMLSFKPAPTTRQQGWMSGGFGSGGYSG